MKRWKDEEKGLVHKRVVENSLVETPNHTAVLRFESGGIFPDFHYRGIVVNYPPLARELELIPPRFFGSQKLIPSKS